jgi:hypothetical protein
MALITETIDTFDVLLIRLKRAAYIGIIIFIILMLLYFINFSTWPLTMSSLTADWSAFGSLLAGAASFLGAIGTVGVMLLGIKQFKIQQDQIIKQTERQDNFEEKQDKKWAKENEMLNFQKYQMHYSSFQQVVKNIEESDGFNYKISSTIDLYKKIFPNNNFENVVLNLNIDEQNHDDGYLNLLINEYYGIYKNLFSFNSNKAEEINKLHNLFKNKSSMLYTENKKFGDIFIFNQNTGFNIHSIQNTLDSMKNFITQLQIFTKHHRDVSVPAAIAFVPMSLCDLLSDLTNCEAMKIHGNDLFLNTLKLQEAVLKHLEDPITSTCEIINQQDTLKEYFSELQDRIENVSVLKRRELIPLMNEIIDHVYDKEDVDFQRAALQKFLN